MRVSLAIVLCAFFFAFGVQADPSADLKVETNAAEAVTPELDATDFLLQNPQFLSDADQVCDTDAEGEGDADADACAPVICNCKCNGVAVAVNLTGRHGETCAHVNGRPCNTGAGWFVYNGC